MNAMIVKLLRIDFKFEKQKSSLSRIISLALGGMVLMFSGCVGPWQGATPGDPFEKWNRSFHSFNHKLDTVLLEPVAVTYAKTVPRPIQKGVTNFFNNLGELNVILNDLLQGKLNDGLGDFGRFAVNSTIGLGGILDVATPMGLPRHEEDFGQTLAVWGFGEGAYLALPILGPSTLRDEPGRLVSSATNILFYINNRTVLFPLGILGTISKRADLIDAIKEVDDSAVDRYVFVREAYLGNRNFHIYDGNPPLEDLFEEEFDFDFDFEDEMEEEEESE